MTNTEAQTPNLLDLPADLVGEDSENFKQWLLAALLGDKPLALSGKGVTRVGTAILQLLVAARRECESRGVRFQLCERSPALKDAIACTGLELALSDA